MKKLVVGEGPGHADREGEWPTEASSVGPHTVTEAARPLILEQQKETVMG